MFKNYFKIAFRNLWKYKGFSAINIIGLALGLACFIMIALYVADELSYDRFNEKADRIYRVNSDIVFGGNKMHMAATSDPMGATLKKDYPQVEEYVRFFAPMNIKRFKKANEYIRETNTVYADSTLFSVFTFPAVTGDTKTALNEPNSVVITEKIAKKYFGTTDAIGKIISEGDKANESYKVTAVIKDMPHNSHFNFDFIFPMDNVDYQWGNFLSNNFQTYILLKPGTDYKAFEKNFDQIITKYVLPQAKQFMNVNSMEEFKKSGNSLEYSLMPLTRIHLHSDRTDEMGVNGNIQYVYIFSVIALLVLLLACINFVNLSTARSAGRAKEVGIRKVLGTNRKWLINQFIAESVLTALLSSFIAIIIVSLAISWFNNLSAKNFSFHDLFQAKYIFFLALLPFLVGIVAGSYPAFFLSSFKPIAVLKGKLNAGFKRSSFRNVMVVAQFFISIFIITGTVVVYRQLSYIQTKKLGYNRDQVLIVRGTPALGNNKEVFKDEVSRLSGVSDATYAGFLPVANSSRTDNPFSADAVMDAKNGVSMQVWDIDEHYIPFMGMEMASGRNFSKQFLTDSSGVIINETAAKLLGLEKPLGKKIYSQFQGQNGSGSLSYNIIGVVKNFHFESLKENIGPLCFRYGKSDWAMAFKVNTANIQALTTNVESKWKSLAPGQPFVYVFMDEWFDDMYRVEQRTGKLGLTFAIIAILIACLGLFGLATYMAEQRVKEIGVRKVLGATVTNITAMLSKDFVKLVLIAAVIAFPVSWYVMRKWLQDFAYRINISWWVFALAGVAVLLIALATVSFQAIKAAIANPIKSLRTE
ncbi:MAG: ABC transporter permease [Chitinophagaceae bacterium]|nr:ABC transporter permease [Chitinophagaceae bacterium]